MFSGAMDIIATKSPSGTFRSTSFHIRFGSLKILKSKDKLIDIYVNGEKKQVQMKLSGSGDAYFTYEDPKKEYFDINKLHVEEDQNYENNNDNLSSDSEDNYSNVMDERVEIKSIADIGTSRTFMATSTNHLDSVVIQSQFLISNCQKELFKMNLGENPKDIFVDNIIEKEVFYADPWSVLNNKNIVFYYKGSLYNYVVAIPLLISLVIYKEPMPEEKLKFLLESSKINPFSSFKFLITQKDILERKKSLELKKGKTVMEIKKKKYRSFSPSSDQLKLLDLKTGINEIVFVCDNSLSGIQKLKAHIYLWSYNSKVVISDIDGTITKSDILGQLMPMLGKDWSHQGVTDLYTNISKNGYKFIYLTARAICQSGATKNYLNSLFQEKKGLPPGPLLMSPDGLFSSFKREVLDKNPHYLKSAILNEVKKIFGKNSSPFYAGFGNRESDATAYRAVGVEMERIFIINKSGEVVQLNNSIKKSYTLLNGIVNDLFPAYDDEKEEKKVM